MTQLNNLTASEYETLYQESITDPGRFWSKLAKELLDWHTPWTHCAQTDMAAGDIQWFTGGKLNVSVNCLDRHLPEHADKVAFYFEGDEPCQSATYTYQALYEQVCLMANTLRALGVQKGDRVCIYLPMIPQTFITMLACARIGAVHTVVFGGFSASALHQRIVDAGCQLVVTADEGRRGGKTIPLKACVYDALRSTNPVSTVLTLRLSGNPVPIDPLRDRWYHDVVSTQSLSCEPTWCDAEDPLFILYTSGSTGKPKGIVHTQAGYLLNAMATFQTVFGVQPDDRFWCTADAGWITGHTYGLYGPLASAATCVIHEGTPSYPTASRWWEIIDTYQVTHFYTAPTAIRALMALGEAPLASTKRDSLKVLGSVGEPINPEAWRWYFNQVGKQRCPIVDTWWQTETGAILIAPPRELNNKPGCAGKPLFGVLPKIVNENGESLPAEESGKLLIQRSWPSQMRSVYQQPERFIDTYLRDFPGQYLTGDGAYQDESGDYWIIGRLDDVLNVSGHRIGTAEIESVLVKNPHVAEAAVIGKPHDVKGEVPLAFVMLNMGESESAALEKVLLKSVATAIGKFAQPEHIVVCQELPKTRSGKIMRRLLKAAVKGNRDAIGDTSTLANPDALDEIFSKVTTLLEEVV